MQIHVLALNRTDSVTQGFLPAAQRLGARVTVLTDMPEQYAGPGATERDRRPGVIGAEAAWPHPGRPGMVGGEAAGPDRVVRCNVRDPGAVVACISELGRPDAIFTNSDHLQAQAALAAQYFGLPGKSWTATVRTKNKALMRRHLRQCGLDAVTCVEIGPEDDPEALAARPLPYPCVLKPREGVASEDVVLVADPGELAVRVREIRGRRPADPLVAEEYLDGPLHTLETLGSASGLRVLGGFRTRLSPPPHFVEQALQWHPDLPTAVREDVLRQLDALGVGLGACHTEFVVQGARARLVEVNYRIIGDQCDLLLAELLGEPLFELVLRAHLGEDVASGSAAAGSAVRRHGRVEYVCAQASGLLQAAPAAQDRNGGAVGLRYRPLRQVGHSVAVTHTNRDYLGVLRAIGDDAAAVDRAVTDFLAAHRWEVRP